MKFYCACVCVQCSDFIRNLFPDDISADKRSRPTTASTKIRVSAGLGWVGLGWVGLGRVGLGWVG